MDSTREQILDLIFSLNEDELEQLREWINANINLEEYSKAVMNKIIDNAKDATASTRKD